MDGLLIIDKPAGPTSHDVVARARRLLREKRVGHTGTLDPFATGVLPLVVGRATRLARFLSASDKTYEAVVALGYATDTGDATGAPIARAEGRDRPPAPSRDEIEQALDRFRGTFQQQPPAFSAKKIGGRRSYELARMTRASAKVSDDSVDQAVLLAPPPQPLPQPVSVTVRRLDLVDVDADRVTLYLECSAGFFVRSLAHDLGEELGVGAHLQALRRTRTGDWPLDTAVTLAEAEADPAEAVRRLIPLGRMLPGLPAGILTPGGVRLAGHGRDLGPGAFESPVPILATFAYVRLMDAAGDLIGIAEPSGTPGLLHPFVVLG